MKFKSFLWYNIVMKINDLNTPLLDIFTKVTDKQLLHYHEPVKEGLFIAESPNVILRALNAGYKPLSLLTEDKISYTEDELSVIECLQNDGLPVYRVPLAQMTQLAGYPMTRGMLCAMHRKPLTDYQRLCTSASRIAILENVMNPTNIGAIMRSAAALGIDAVLLTPGCCDPLYRRAVRVSMGTVFQIPWTVLDVWPIPVIEKLHAFGFKTAAMALENDTLNIHDPQLKRIDKLAIILGTEGEGLSKNTISDCDFTVKIPMSHGVDSLNVAAASAVAFYALGKNA